MNIDFDKLMIKKDDSKHVRVDDKIYCSELNSCPRKIFYNRKFPQDFDRATLGRFSMGNVVHEYVSSCLKNIDSGFKFVGSEISHKLELQEGILSGRIDNVIANPEGIQIPIEVKTTSKPKFSPVPENILQIMSYVKMMDVPEGILLYIGKDTLETNSFVIKRDEIIINNIIRDCNDVIKGLKTNLPPIKYPTIDNCQWCIHKARCFNGE